MEKIKADKYSFYINQEGNKIDIVIALSSTGVRYLKSVNDKDQPDSLLRLPLCEI